MATWDPTFKNNITLSNSDLTAVPVTGGTPPTVRCTTYIGASDKRYYKITIDSLVLNNMNIALVNSSYSIPQSPDFNTTGIAYYNNNGQVRYNSTTLSTIETYTAGDIIYVAVDKVNGKVWFKKNSGNWNNNASANPATNTGGIAVSVSGNLYPLVQLSQNCQITADFTSNTGAPSGFSAFPIQTVVTTTGAGSFTIPAGVTSITVEAWGHGGNGDAQSNQGAGGSGGGYIHVDIPVTAGDVLNWNIPSTTTAVGTVFAKNNSPLSAFFVYGGGGVAGHRGPGFGGR
jgi:hypothetical protein